MHIFNNLMLFVLMIMIYFVIYYGRIVQLKEKAVYKKGFRGFAIRIFGASFLVFVLVFYQSATADLLLVYTKMGLIFVCIGIGVVGAMFFYIPDMCDRIARFMGMD